jgi:PAS domain S-box-containing protein
MKSGIMSEIEMKSKIERNQRTQHEIDYQKTIRRNLAKSLSNSPLGMMYWKYSSGQATVLEWNRTAEKLFGWSPKEMVGYNFMEKLYYPDDIEDSHHRIQQLQKSKHSYHFQNKCYTKNNQILTIKWFVSFIKEDPDGSIYGMSLAENLTEIENAKQNMELLKKQLEYALEGSRAGSWDWHIDIDQLDVNDRWLEIFGYQQDKIRKLDYLSKENFWLSCIHPDDLSKYHEEMQKHLTKQSDYFHCDYRILTKDAKWIWIEDRGKITQVSESGTPMRMSGTIQNITYQRKVFQDLQIRNSISSVFVEHPNDTFFPELLAVILQLTSSKQGAIGYFREDQSCFIASLSDNMYKGTAYTFPFKLSYEDWQQTSWGKYLLQENEGLQIFPRLLFLKGCPHFQQSVVVPIKHMENCIGFFIISNVSGNYSSEYFDVANTITTRMSHLFYSRLQSLFNEEKRYIAEHNLIASEEKLEGALEASNIGSWEWQISQDHLHFDTRFMRILGYSEQTFTELNITKWNQIIHPDDMLKNESDYQKHFLGLKPHHGVDIRLQHKNGSWIWVTKRGKFTDYDQEGNPIQMNGTITEITKVKQAQLEAREQRDELEWLLAGHQELLTKISDKSLFSYIAQTLSKKIPNSIIFVFQATSNQEALRLETYETSDESFRKSLVQWLLPRLSQYEIPITNEYLPIFSSNTLFKIPKSFLFESMGFFSRSVTKLFQNILGIQHIHMIGFTGNKGHMGSAMIVQLGEEPIQHTKTIESFVYQASLVLERILLEAEEQANRTRLEQVTEQSKSIIWETDLNGTITFISSYVKELLGYAPDELILKKTWADLHTDQEKDGVLLLFHTKLAKGDSYKNVFTELKTKDGEILYVSSNAVPIINNNVVAGYRGADYDITILRNMDQAKNEFINTVSHEMRTPLTVVREANTILEMEDLTQQQRHVLEISKKNIDRLSRIINDVLDYQKLQAKKVELVYQTIDLRKFFKDIMDSYTVVAEKKHLLLSLQMKTHNPFLSTDEDKLYEVIGNLLDNAIKYTNQGSVSIRVEDKNSETLCCTIQDTGLGIDKKEIPKLFKAFSQTSAVHSQKTGSTGLGLAICKEIVHLLQGSISVESKIGEGTTFFVLIPRKKGKRKE